MGEGKGGKRYSTIFCIIYGLHLSTEREKLIEHEVKFVQWSMVTTPLQQVYGKSRRIKIIIVTSGGQKEISTQCYCLPFGCYLKFGLFVLPIIFYLFSCAIPNCFHSIFSSRISERKINIRFLII